MTSWRRSSFCGPSACVEVALLPDDEVMVRDGKDDGAGPVLVFTSAEWDAFLRGARAGEFDLPGGGSR